MEDLTNLSVTELQSLYAGGGLKPADVVRACIGRIEERDPAVKAFLSVFPDEAMKRAVELESLDPEEKPLYGIPVAIKDNICTRGLPTTAASKILENYHPPYDATVVGRLHGAGAIVIGKTNMDEFAMGSSTENSAFQVTCNPWDLDSAPGGSSGGSAAAVAAGMVPLALGSDTGGSIRQPAGFCGVAGLKGTYGRVSRYGLIAFASSLDQIGPIARGVRDCAIAMQIISGHDSKDATTIPGDGAELTQDIDMGIEGLRIAAPAALDDWDLEDSVNRLTLQTIGDLKDRGAVVDRVELPGMDTSIACYYILANAEASSNLARYDGVKYGYRSPSRGLRDMYERTRGEGFGEEVKRRILLGTYVLSSGYYEAYYSKARQVKALIREGYERIFREFDLIVLPTSPTPAFRLGERVDDPIAMYLSDIFTTPANIAGLPAVSVPAGLSVQGLPIGMQLIAGVGREAVLLRGAMALEGMYRFKDQFTPGFNAE